MSGERFKTAICSEPGCGAPCNPPKNPGAKPYCIKCSYKHRREVKSFIAAEKIDPGAAFVDSILSIRPQPTVKKPDAIKSHNESVVIAIGDLHFGQRNQNYNSVIAAQRLDQFADNVTHLVARHVSKSVAIDEIVISLGGDIVDGDAIYDGQSFDVDGPAFGQVRGAVEHLWALAQSVKGAMPAVELVRFECVPGNHGLVKSRRGGSPTNNYDNFVYHGLDLLAATDDRIIVNYSTGEFHNFAVKGHKFHARHYGPKGVWTPAQIRKVQAWRLIHHADVLMFHHWHQSDWANCFGPVVWNGCMCGSTAHSENLGYESSLSQWLFGVSDKRITYRYEVDFK